MSNATWPLDLPQRVGVEGFQEWPKPRTRTTEMDAGPARKRRITTGGPRYLELTLQALTSAQCETLLAFWETTLAAGVLAFEWVHPRTQAPATFRFRGDEPPRISQRGASPNRWNATLELEQVG